MLMPLLIYLAHFNKVEIVEIAFLSGIKLYIYSLLGSIVQLDRISDFGSEG